jgi:cysteine desulfurase/selenocysteine lyase
MTQVSVDWRQEWHAIDDATYLNTASRGPMPRAALGAVLDSLDVQKFPHHASDSTFFERSNRLRQSLAAMIAATPAEIALTTGASAGMAAVVQSIAWKPGDEVITAKDEFPVQYTTWKPMEAQEGLTLKTVAPRDRFITADDLIQAITPRTRVVSVSHVRFDDGTLLDAGRLAAACHAREVLLVLDASQSCGAMPLDVAALGADFMVCAGYKWLFGPYGTGFLWIRSEHLSAGRRGPFNWAAQDAETFSALNFVDPEPSQGARRWDAAESATHFNLNLTAMDAAVEFVRHVGPATVREHNLRLIQHLFDRLPQGCLPASPLDPAQRGPYGCFTGRTPEETVALYQRLRTANVVVSLRGGRIRVSPHLFNSTEDIDRLVEIASA